MKNIIARSQQLSSCCLRFVCLNLEGNYFLEAIDNRGNIYACTSIFGSVAAARREVLDLQDELQQDDAFPFWWRRIGNLGKSDRLYCVTATYEGIRRIRFRESTLKRAEFWKAWCERNEFNSKPEIIIVNFN